MDTNHSIPNLIVLPHVQSIMAPEDAIWARLDLARRPQANWDLSNGYYSQKGARMLTFRAVREALEDSPLSQFTTETKTTPGALWSS